MSIQDSAGSTWTWDSHDLHDMGPLNGAIDIGACRHPFRQEFMPSEVSIRRLPTKSPRMSGGEHMSFSSSRYLKQNDHGMPPTQVSGLGNFSGAFQHPKVEPAMSLAPTGEVLGQPTILGSSSFDDAFVWRSTADAGQFAHKEFSDHYTAADMVRFTHLVHHSVTDHVCSLCVIAFFFSDMGLVSTAARVGGGGGGGAWIRGWR